MSVHWTTVCTLVFLNNGIFFLSMVFLFYLHASLTYEFQHAFKNRSQHILPFFSFLWVAFSTFALLLFFFLRFVFLLICGNSLCIKNINTIYALQVILPIVMFVFNVFQASFTIKQFFGNFSEITQVHSYFVALVLLGRFLSTSKLEK